MDITTLLFKILMFQILAGFMAYSITKQSSSRPIRHCGLCHVQDRDHAILDIEGTHVGYCSFFDRSGLGKYLKTESQRHEWHKCLCPNCHPKNCIQLTKQTPSHLSGLVTLCRLGSL